eukprot:s522_g18.t1
MQNMDKTPWRCIHCKQLRKRSATHCQTCNVAWQQAMDYSYVHGAKQGSSQTTYNNPWSGYGNQYYQGDQGAQQRTQSPRSKGRGKGNSPRSKGAGKDVSNFHFPPPPQMPYQPPYVPPGPPLPPPATPAPWMGPPMQMQAQAMPNMTAMPAMTMQSMPQMSSGMPPMQQMMPGPCAGHMIPMTMPVPSLPQNSQDAAQKELIAYIRNRQADLPPDMQQKIATFSRREGAKLTKDLQTQAKVLGDAREELEAALAARAQHIGTWKVFLAEAVRNWTEYANLFDQHERSLQARIVQAKQQFHEARDCVEEAKVAAGQVSARVQEISDEDDMPGDQETSAQQIKASMSSLSSSLTQLQKDAESIKVEIPSSKRQRRDAEEPPAAGGGEHFGPAG